jgi:hypothetical protein
MENPGLSLTQAMLLALTDSIWRPFHETFSGLARNYGIYVLATTIVPDATVSDDPSDVSLFGDPSHPERTYVYLPQSQYTYNQAVLYDPEGELLMRTRKVHFVELEEELLQLEHGAVEEINVFPINGAIAGVAICLDAWYDDVLSRLRGLGANLLVQPSANSAMWGGSESYWEPDAWYGSAWTAVHSGPEFLFGVNPMLTGNLFEIPFDGQTSIITGEAGQPMQGYIGTEYRDGFLSLAPWVIDDPCAGTPSDECRAIIMQKAVALAPGGVEENNYLETVPWEDLSFVDKAEM